MTWKFPHVIKNPSQLLYLMTVLFTNNLYDLIIHSSEPNMLAIYFLKIEIMYQECTFINLNIFYIWSYNTELRQMSDFFEMSAGKLTFWRGHTNEHSHQHTRLVWMATLKESWGITTLKWLIQKRWRCTFDYSVFLKIFLVPYTNK